MVFVPAQLPGKIVKRSFRRPCACLTAENALNRLTKCETMSSTAAFRTALGLFATGVAVITTEDSAAQASGDQVTHSHRCRSDPPSFLWCVDKKSDRDSVFTQARHYT